MATINKYEDLEVWKLSMDLCLEVYNATNQEQFSKDFGLKDQIRRCSVSIPSNIAEGFERDSTNQFLYFLTIAKGSAGELRTQLIIASRLNYIESTQFELLVNKCIETEKQLGGFKNYLIKIKNSKKQVVSN
jgi:four helix bundle protein